VIRLSRKGKARNIWQKLIEMYLAFRMEAGYSKKEILGLYASNAPFGGNVVGLDAASWRYFARSSDNLSWAEICLLAVLPNSPALIHPGKNREILKEKRDRLLKQLYLDGEFSYDTYLLSVAENIPDQPMPFPHHAPHLLNRVLAENRNKEREKIAVVKTTVDINMQKSLNRILNEHHENFKGNGIWNIAAIIIDVDHSDVMAYAGNLNDLEDTDHGNHVDIIMSERSTGSILKPFLYAAMMTSGELLPNTLVADIPTHISGYAPRNFNLGYDGAVPARQALSRSLNVPAVRMLQSFGVEKFIHVLRKAGLTTITKSADYYGLSLILGGCEAKLWELTGVYAGMARSLKNYRGNNSLYNENEYYMPNYTFGYENPHAKNQQLTENCVFSASSIWFTFEAMQDVDRPGDEGRWQYFSSSRKIAWKTGTSFGFRDGWAIGITPEYIIGVWVGNADGEGRPTLTGINTAAKILFDLYELMPASKGWFDPPFDDMVKTIVCRKSGYLATEICAETDTVWIPSAGINSSHCPYHRIIHLDKTGAFRVHSDCEEPSEMIHTSWFILPPAMEWYYKSKNSNYKTLPPYREDCTGSVKSEENKAMEIIYPSDLMKIYVPLELSGERGSTVFEVAHRKPNTTIFWYVDNDFIGETRKFHHMALSPAFGKHILTLVDEFGEKTTREFIIIDKEKSMKN
ncbi:MAG: penicillin-binding protein 1C, partial [Bacteroidota bacterium]